MNVGIITDEISQDLSEAIAVMKRCDVSIAEIRAVWGKNSVDMDSDEISRIKKLLDDAGMTVCGLASPFYKCDIDPATSAARGRLHEAKDLTMDDQIPLLERCFRVADQLGTRMIRIFSFWRTSDPTPEIEDKIVELLQKPLKMAEEHGFVLAMENEHACFLGTGAETGRVLSRIDSKAIGGVWDPGNAFYAGEKAFPEGYNAMKPYISHIHIKDAIRKPDGSIEFVRVGAGEIGYEEHFRQLKQDGYDANITLETHYSIEPGGKAAASEESLKILAGLARGV